MVTDKQKVGDHCHDCGTLLERAVIYHDSVNGNTLGWECPTCRAKEFDLQRQFAEAAHVGL